MREKEGEKGVGNREWEKGELRRIREKGRRN